MTNKNSEDFNLGSLFVGPATFVTAMLGVADNARKAVSGVAETIASLQRAAKALEALAGRLDAVVAEIEAPTKLLGPELERGIARLLQISDIAQGPIDRLLPGVEQAVAALERVSLPAFADSIEIVQGQIQPLLDTFREAGKAFGIGNLGSLIAPFGKWGAPASSPASQANPEDPPRQTGKQSATKRKPPVPNAGSSKKASLTKKPGPAKKPVSPPNGIGQTDGKSKRTKTVNEIPARPRK